MTGTGAPNAAATVAGASAVYVDACCLVKIAKEEGESTRAMRCLIYGSLIPVYSSMVGFGEFIGVLGKRCVQAQLGIGGYLHNCRALMADFELGTIRRAEPCSDRLLFLCDAQRVHARRPEMGGGDLWHILSAIELRRQRREPLFVTYDGALVEDATAAGLQAVDAKPLTAEAIIGALSAAGKYVTCPSRPGGVQGAEPA